MMPTAGMVSFAQRGSAQPLSSMALSFAAVLLHVTFASAVFGDEAVAQGSGIAESGIGGVTIRLHLHPATSAAIQSPPGSGQPIRTSSQEAEVPVEIAVQSPNQFVRIDDEGKTIQCQFDGPLQLTDSSGPNKIPSDSNAKKLSKTLTSREKTAVDDRTAEKLESDKSTTDSSKECPGSPTENTQVQQVQPDDIPLEQDEHPYDAPPAESTGEVESPATPTRLFTAREERIRQEIQRCLDYFLAHPENTTRRGPWALMHAALPFGVEGEIFAGNRRVNTLGWMCFNGTCAKQNMFQPTRQGFRTNVGPGVQGHEGQFLAILAQSKVGSDYPLQIGNRRYNVMDLVRYEMATCREQSELTFKLIGLSHYLDQNQRWRDDRGQTWNLEKMVAEELAQPIIGAACGGSHRLMGLSYAVIQRQSAGQPLNGHWYRAEQYLNDYVNYAMSLQNPDGSFSTDWFESRGMDPDVERKVQTTGHILEWLVFTLPDDHLRSPRIQLSLEFLLGSVGKNPGYDWPIGPRGHALRAMSLYSQRIFGAQPGQLKAFIAQAEFESSRR